MVSVFECVRNTIYNLDHLVIMISGICLLFCNFCIALAFDLQCVTQYQLGNNERVLPSHMWPIGLDRTPLVREGPGSNPGTGKLDTGFLPKGLNK